MMAAILIAATVAGAWGEDRKVGSSMDRYEVREVVDQVFAEIDGRELLLDLHLPVGVERPPLVVWIHGGGWRNGSRQNCRMAWAAEYGYAVASISYRFINTAIFPAQIHDCKAALRWLRANAGKFGYDPARVVVAGSSAGGHLAMLVGVTGDSDDLEGDVGDNPGVSTRVRAIVNYFGPSDFALRARTQPERALSVAAGSFRLLGGTETSPLDAALESLASPTTHVTADDPPLLSFQGTADRLVFVDQAQRITDVYREKGLEAELHLVEGAGHGDRKLFEGTYRQAALDFLAKHLR